MHTKNRQLYVLNVFIIVLTQVEYLDLLVVEIDILQAGGKLPIQRFFADARYLC